MTGSIGPEQMTHTYALGQKFWQRKHLGFGSSSWTTQRRFFSLVLSTMQEMSLVVKRDFDLINAEKLLKGLYFHQSHLKQEANGVKI